MGGWRANGKGAVLWIFAALAAIGSRSRRVRRPVLIVVGVYPSHRMPHRWRCWRAGGGRAMIVDGPADLLRANPERLGRIRDLGPRARQHRRLLSLNRLAGLLPAILMDSINFRDHAALASGGLRTFGNLLAFLAELWLLAGAIVIFLWSCGRAPRRRESRWSPWSRRPGPRPSKRRSRSLTEPHSRPEMTIVRRAARVPARTRAVPKFSSAACEAA